MSALLRTLRRWIKMLTRGKGMKKKLLKTYAPLLTSDCMADFSLSLPRRSGRRGAHVATVVRFAPTFDFETSGSSLVANLIAFGSDGTRHRLVLSPFRGSRDSSAMWRVQQLHHGIGNILMHSSGAQHLPYVTSSVVSIPLSSGVALHHHGRMDGPHEENLVSLYSCADSDADFQHCVHFRTQVACGMVLRTVAQSVPQVKQIEWFNKEYSALRAKALERISSGSSLGESSSAAAAATAVFRCCHHPAASTAAPCALPVAQQLLRRMCRTFPQAADFFEFRTRFTQQLAASSLLQHLFSVDLSAPTNVVFSLTTGSVVWRSNANTEPRPVYDSRGKLAVCRYV